MIDGWVEYPYAQTVFAAWQAGAAVQRADARSARPRGPLARRGARVRLPRRHAAADDPAARRRCPRDTIALRLHTTQEIYWDRIERGLRRAGCRTSSSARLPLAAATLRAVGLRASHHRAAAHAALRLRPPRAAAGDTRHPRGWYTALRRRRPARGARRRRGGHHRPRRGSAAGVRRARRAAAGRLDAPDRAATPSGWCKDMDLYTQGRRDGGAAARARTPTARARLHAAFNTRYEGGR